MKKSVLLDSSVYLSLFLRDGNYGKAQKLICFLQKQGYVFVLSDLVLGEIVGVLSKNSNSIKEIVTNLEFIIRLNHIVLSVDFSKHLNLIRKVAIQSRLKSMDLFILSSVYILKIEKFFSFDNRQFKAYKKNIM